MLKALNEYHIRWLDYKYSFLSEILKHKDFVKGNFDINFLEKKFLGKGTGNNGESPSEKISAIFSAIFQKHNVLIIKLI